MRINKLGWIVAITLTGMISTTPLLRAADGDPAPNREGRQQRGPRGNAEARLKRMTEQLDLSKEQQTKLAAVFEAQNKAMEKMRDVPREERREKFGKLREEFDGKVLAVLNDTQKEKYKKMQTQLRERRGGAERGQRGAGDRPQRPERPKNDK